MNRVDMLSHLVVTYDSWQKVYEAYSALPTRDRCLQGWYHSFDGPSLDEMYLTNKHPMGDESGEVIGYVDFIKLYSFVDGVTATDASFETAFIMAEQQGYYK